MSKRNIKYQGLSLPVSILEQIKEHKKNNEGYTSVTDFVKESIREKLRNEKNDVSKIDRFLEILDNLKSINNKIILDDEKFKQIAKEINNIYKLLNEWGYNVGELNFSPEFMKELEKYCRDNDITPAEIIRSSVLKEIKKDIKKTNTKESINGHGLS